jgi:hypothetical protein
VTFAGLFATLLLSAPPSTVEPAPIGAWASYKWVRPGGADTLIRYSIVPGKAEGSRRMEIDYQRAENRAYIAYDMLTEGAVSEVTLQMGPGAAPFLLPLQERNQSKPTAAPDALSKAQKKQVTAKLKPTLLTVKTASGSVLCQVTQTPKSETCVSKDLRPTGLVWMRNFEGGRMDLIAFGTDARSRIVRTPRKLPQHLINLIEAPALPEMP